MSTVTYTEYLEYIKIEFSKVDPSALSQEEKDYYDIVKRDLENSKNMPVRILKSLVLASEKELNSETLRNLEYIKSKVGIQGKVNKFREIIVEKFFNKSNSFVPAFNFAVVAISLIIFYFLVTSFPLTTTISTPNLTWHVPTSEPITVSTAEPGSLLVGVAGQNGEDEKAESHILVVAWEKFSLDVTYFIWGIVPIIALFLIIYFPAIRWFRPK